ncbi:hypothetical protein C1I92_20580 [Jiangella anatolica]|uniref:RiboL-PSP-HEPN domain-containing protein n=2 Tax=Jiangella anatolica TaxID=2670374 RepID=A0A2W2C0U9_9ACTN|nr:hypothetical protein C1I92_20580 [Jiangella anatolica]
MLQRGATFSHQLKILLPSVMAERGAPAVTQELHEALGDLVSLRNAVAHRHQPITRGQAIRVLLAAVFCYWYLALYG